MLQIKTVQYCTLPRLAVAGILSRCTPRKNPTPSSSRPRAPERIQKQAFEAPLDSLNHVDECIATKHRDPHHTPTVAPSVDLAQKGKESADTLFFKLRNNP
jgi:hypothetical protein